MKNKIDIFKKNLASSISIKNLVLADKDLLKKLEDVTNAFINTFQSKGTVLFCGNGGSAADAQHLAAEFSGRFYYDRDPLDSEALHVNTSYLTAVANDYSYDEVFARMVKARGKKNDLIIGLSTSGNSKNVLRAFEEAKNQEMTTVLFTGQDGTNQPDIVDYLLKIPSNDTPRIQECHMLLGHTICELVEAELFPKS